MSIRYWVGGGVIGLSVWLAGCDGAGDKAPAAASASAGAVPTLVTPTPRPPAWAADMVGKPPPAVKAGGVACIGAIDRMVNRFSAERPGVELEGWAWNRTAKTALPRFLVVGSNARVIGAGEPGGSARPDVPAANPNVVTTPEVGWLASAPVTSGAVRVLGLTADGEACDLGTFDIKG